MDDKFSADVKTIFEFVGHHGLCMAFFASGFYLYAEFAEERVIRAFSILLGAMSAALGTLNLVWFLTEVKRTAPPYPTLHWFSSVLLVVSTFGAGFAALLSQWA